MLVRVLAPGSKMSVCLPGGYMRVTSAVHPPRRTGSSIYQLAVEASIDSADTWEAPRRPASAAPRSSKCRPASACRHSSTAAGELHHSVARRPSTAGSLQSYRRTPTVGARTVTTVQAQHSRLRETALRDRPSRLNETTHSRPKRATFRSIGLDAPDWWSPLPPTVAAAVDVFDRRHAVLSARATAALEGAAHGDHPFERAARFEAALLEVQRHRYALPEKARLLQKIAVRPKTAPARRTTCMGWLLACQPAISFGNSGGCICIYIRRAWRLDESIWAPRQRTSESRAFYDTAALRRRMFECDWARALQANRGSLTKHILRHDDDGSQDDNGDGVPDEVQEAGEALWAAQERIYAIFDFYASLGEKDVYSISQNAFTLFVADFGLHEEGSDFCTKKHLDMMFVAVNAGKADCEGGFNQKHALNRQELLHLLVRVAIAKYVLTQQTQDVSEAIERLVQDDLARGLSPECSHSAADFRRRHCYTEAVDVELRAHEASLRAVYQCYCKGGGGVNTKVMSTKMLDIGEWNKLVANLGLIDSALTSRHATLAFVWSRMRVADEVGARLALTHLHFEDFLELLVRVACIKPWPTPDEVRRACCLDAGHFLIELQAESPQLYDEWCEARRRPWHAPEPAQPVAMCVRHLLTLVLRTIEASTPGSDNLRITEFEAKAFYALQQRTPADALLECINRAEVAAARKRPELARTSTAGTVVRVDSRLKVETVAAVGAAFEAALVGEPCAQHEAGAKHKSTGVVAAGEGAALGAATC